jgi:hypothetical protein
MPPAPSCELRQQSISEISLRFETQCGIYHMLTPVFALSWALARRFRFKAS